MCIYFPVLILIIENYIILTVNISQSNCIPWTLSKVRWYLFPCFLPIKFYERHFKYLYKPKNFRIVLCPWLVGLMSFLRYFRLRIGLIMRHFHPFEILRTLFCKLFESFITIFFLWDQCVILRDPKFEIINIIKG